MKLKEAKLLKKASVRVLKAGQRAQQGPFTVEPFTVAHSVPDSSGLAIKTPVGTVIHTGDFKLDHTPVMEQSTDLPRLAAYGNEGVLLADWTSLHLDIVARDRGLKRLAGSLFEM